MTAKRQSQEGVALITVLLVFAIISVMASQMFVQSQFNSQRSFNQAAMSQARYYTFGAEALARQILYEDWENRDIENPVDHKQDNWAQTLQVFDIDEGQMTLVISDLQSRFNLNNLINQDQQINSDAAVQFQRLLAKLRLSGSYGPILQDWLDSDQKQRATDTEDAGYQKRNPAYLVANRSLGNASEILALKGMNLADYELLRQNVTALPEQTRVNLNTANEVVLQALGTDITERHASALVKQQNSNPVTDLEQFFNTATGQAFAEIVDSVSINSDYFLIETTAVYAGRRSTLATVLYRNPENGAMSVISRNFNPGFRLLL